ncbi:IucA/IucC family protein [Aminobacter aganoensis]|uniref:Siderophore synthetase component n=1 Tax=Aminobacter aganoensis TaxID=83264 RepID=A0A7X0F8Y6_9HYPH|nr:IucA/IucC family protein [Aminobacter aganoensis]MBB6355316.1 siderophore synthetase component [Aminobacter aganoensis]
MKLTPRQVAEHATFQNFANCYVREISPGRVTQHRGGAEDPVDCIEWVLAAQQLVLRAELVSHSRCGPHRFGQTWVRRATDAGWRHSEPFAALQLLLHEAYRQLHDERSDAMRGCELELLGRALQSYQQTLRYIEAHGAATEDDSFIAAEQSLVFGHSLHPTPKSRQGMTSWQEPSYAPELHGRFQLVYFAADASVVSHKSAAAETAPEIVAALAGAGEIETRPGEMLLPMHPLQAEALLLDDGVRDLVAAGKLRLAGAAGPAFTATSSVRTVYNEDLPWMLKFSLPVRITNSLRVNSRKELEAGVAVAKLLGRTGIGSGDSRFKVIADPAYITLDLPGRCESGFEVILRENPFVACGGRGKITIAALTAEPLPGQQSRLERIIRALCLRDGTHPELVCKHWFQRYLDCALDPLVSLYDDFGLALEAHQQNSLLDVSQGYPSASYYRDNQGFYLSKRYRARFSLHVPEAAEIASLYYDDRDIQDRFAYYLVVNQIFSVIARMGHDGLIDEEVLLRLLRDRLEVLSRTTSAVGREFVRGVLDRPTVAFKANLMTRLFDVDELQTSNERSLYARQPNPLFAAIAGLYHGDGSALAS